jgi:hypothetical protein
MESPKSTNAEGALQQLRRPNVWSPAFTRSGCEPPDSAPASGAGRNSERIAQIALHSVSHEYVVGVALLFHRPQRGQKIEK